MREIKPQFVNKKTDKSMFLDKMYGGNRNEITISEETSNFYLEILLEGL